MLPLFSLVLKKYFKEKEIRKTMRFKNRYYVNSREAKRLNSNISHIVALFI